MPEQHIAIFKALGLPDDKITAIEGLTAEQLKEFKPDDYVNTIQTGVKNVLTNDPAFLSSIPEDKISPTILKKIESGQYARFQNELVEVATKKLGLEDKELTAEDRKSIKGLAEKMATLYLGKNSKVEGLQEMQGKLSTALQSIETMKGEHTENLKTELEKANGANTSKLIKTLTKVELAGLDDIQLAVAANFISDPVLAELASQYTIVLDANDNLDIKQKANSALDVVDDKGKKVTFQAALRKVVVEKKLGTEIKEDDPEKLKKKKVIIEGGGGGGDKDQPVVASYIAEKIATVKD